MKLSEGKLPGERLSFRFQTLQQGGWLLAATVISGIFAYLANMSVGRMLGPADYSIFASLNSLYLILAMVAQVIQTVTTNYVARLRSQEATDKIGQLLVYLLKHLSLWGIGGTLVLALLSQPLATFLRLPSIIPVLVLSLSLIPIILLPVVNGVQRGLQYFNALGGTYISAAAFRLIAAVGLVTLGLGVPGAVASLAISGFGAAGLGLLFLWGIFRQRNGASRPDLTGIFNYSLNAILAIFCFALLSNGDVIIVKSRFSPTDAGLYSAMAVLGKTTFWLSSAVVTLLLPKASERHARGQLAVGLARTSLLTVGLLCGSVSVAFFLFPSFLMSTLFGPHYVAYAFLLGWYGLAMSLFSLVNVWLIYYLAVQEQRYTYMLLFGVTLLATFLALFGSGPTQVVAILTGVGLVLFLGGLWLSWKRR